MKNKREEKDKTQLMKDKRIKRSIQKVTFSEADKGREIVAS